MFFVIVSWNLSDEKIKQIPYDDINKALEFIENIQKTEDAK